MSTRPAHLRPITVDIPATWTPEQALAAFELLDELREKIWTRYGGQMLSMPVEIRSYLPMCRLTADPRDGVPDCPGSPSGGTRPRSGAPLARSGAKGAGGTCGPTGAIRGRVRPRDLTLVR